MKLSILLIALLSTINVVAKTTTTEIADPSVTIYPGASPVEVLAKQAILVDYNTGLVLLQKNADEKMPPSSMTKMMTAYLLEEKIAAKEITNDTEFLVSEKAWRTQGSKMFIHVGNKVKVADLHKGIAIQSGNDASVTVAEGLMGSEEAFATSMNLMARKLGMTSTNFKNASGLPDEDHYSTARDLSRLANAVIKNHGEFYSVNQEKEFTYNGIKQGNRNPLLYDNLNCDGIKTGHTDAGGFGIAASCLDAQQRYILVINGLKSMQARADEARKLMGWAKANFIGKTLIKKGDVVVDSAKIEVGEKESVSLRAADDIYMLMLRAEQDKVALNRLVYTPINAPIKEGDTLGKLTASLGNSTISINLVAAESVDKLGWFKRILKWVGFI